MNEWLIKKSTNVNVLLHHVSRDYYYVLLFSFFNKHGRDII